MRTTRRMYAAAVAGVAALLGSFISATTATAAGETTVAWTHTHQYTTTKLIASRGAVTAASCMTPYSGVGGPAAVSYGTDGSTLGTVPASTNDKQCEPEQPPLLDKDGNSYLDAGGTRGYNHVPEVHSYTKAGVARWVATLPQLCEGDDAHRYLANRVIGSDGNLYGVMRTNCTDGGIKASLVGFNGSDGSLRFNKDIPPYDLHYAHNLHASRLGLALLYTGWNGGIQHFDYAGNEVAKTKYRQQFDNSHFIMYDGGYETLGSVAGGVNGNVAILTAKFDNEVCGGSEYLLTGVESYMPWGLEWRTPLEGRRLCTQYAQVQVMPDGGAVMVARVPSGLELNPYKTVVYRLNNNGNHQRVRWSRELLAGISKEFSGEQERFVGVDVNGNILLERRYIVTSGSDVQSHFQIVRLNDGNNGAQSVLADTLNSGHAGSFDRLGWNDATFGNGQVYVPYYRSCNGAPDCTDQAMLFAFSTPGIGLDYPRTRVLNATEVSTAQGFQALGDSFISGEGDNSQGFVVNRGDCHVSNTAWPMRVTGDTRLNLTLTAFPACSGATAVQMRKGGDKPKQINKITPGAAAYAVSAGGNDALFPKLIASCILLSCGSMEPEVTGKINNLHKQLTPLYDEVRAVAGPDADIYVMGYPKLLPNTSCTVAPLGIEVLSQLFLNPATKSAVTEWLAGIEVNADDYANAIAASNFTFSAEEAAVAKRITEALNNKIKQVVESRGDAKFHFVAANYTGGPFQGKTLCSDNPAFNGLVTTFSDPTALKGNLMMSFHPNTVGTAAYKKMFLDCRLNSKNCN